MPRYRIPKGTYVGRWQDSPWDANIAAYDKKADSIVTLKEVVYDEHDIAEVNESWFTFRLPAIAHPYKFLVVSPENVIVE